MSKITLEGNASGTGTFTIAAPNSNTSYTLTLPQTSGTILTSGGSQTIEFAAGSASTPSITTTGDTNTGIFFPAADTIAFAEGGVESMRIDSSGNLGLGVTPSAWSTVSSTRAMQFPGGGTTWGQNFGGNNPSMQVACNAYLDSVGYKYFQTAPASQYQQNAGTHSWTTAASGTAGNAITFTECARITSDGKFLVNETAQLAGYNQQATITCSGSNVLALALKASGSGNIALATTSTDTSTYNAAVFANNGNFSGALKGSISVSNSATTYNTSSDYRLKENIAPMTGALDKVAQLKPCTYIWKVDGSSGQGFIAHELQSVVPDCVTGEKDAEREVDVFDEEGNKTGTKVEPVYQGVDTSFLVATLTAAIQELKAINDAQASRIETLETKVAALEAK